MSALERCLADLEERIDPAVEERLYSEWREFADGRFQGELFIPTRAHSAPPRVDWPTVSVNAALEDQDRMVLQQLGACSAALAKGSGELLCVRSNYGTSILPSLFGVELFLMAEELDTLPTSRPLGGGADTIRRLLDCGVPDLHASIGGRALDMGARYRELFARYPKIGRYVNVYHPDTQGPIDVCELLVGSDLFLLTLDEPDLLATFLGLVTDTYIAYLDQWYRLFPPADDYAAHWGMLHRGRIMIRNDSAMNLSADAYERLCEPHDQRLLDHFGGGAIHFCGRGQHFIERLAALRGLSAVNLTQPELNDMELIYRHTVDRGTNLLALRADVARDAVARGRPLRGRVHAA